jgi:hypothetical protein
MLSHKTNGSVTDLSRLDDVPQSDSRGSAVPRWMLRRQVRRLQCPKVTGNVYLGRVGLGHTPHRSRILS